MYLSPSTAKMMNAFFYLAAFFSFHRFPRLPTSVFHCCFTQDLKPLYQSIPRTSNILHYCTEYGAIWRRTTVNDLSAGKSYYMWPWSTVSSRDVLRQNTTAWWWGAERKTITMKECHVWKKSVDRQFTQFSNNILRHFAFDCVMSSLGGFVVVFLHELSTIKLQCCLESLLICWDVDIF